MVQSVRERTSELAVLKTLGFTDTSILVLVLCESLFITVVAGGFGLAVAWVIVQRGDPTGGLLAIFTLPSRDIAIGFALMVLMGLIAGAIPAMGAMKSSAYQLSTQFPEEWKDSYTPYYARRFVRVLTGPEVADALAQVTEQPFSFSLKGQTVTRVKQTASPVVRGGGGGSAARNNDAARLASVTPTRYNDGTAISALMQAFFQSGRETPPSLPNRASAVQAMMMMNSPAVTNRVRPTVGLVQQLVKSEKSDAEITEELFMTAISRKPTTEEVEVGLRILKANRTQGTADILWALLNTPEFLLNY